MPYIEAVPPTPNKDREYIIDITPMTTGEINFYDFSRFLPAYNCRERDNYLGRVRHVIAGKTATVYMIDDYEILTRKQAIKFAGRFIDGNFTVYRLD